MSARKMALDTLRRVYGSGQYTNIAIDKALAGSDLSTADKGLYTALVMGVVERRITLDYYIDRLASQPLRIDGDTRILLRLGIYQLCFLDRIPEYAAINETVSLAPRRTRGFVNAILRNYLRQRDKLALPDKVTDEVEYLSVAYSFPRELCERFLGLFGMERCERIFERYNSVPATTLRINTQKISREDYAEMLNAAGIEYALSNKSPTAILTWGTSYTSLPGAAEGLFFVQDEASQLCVEAAGVNVGDKVIDTCACPGSKSFGMAMNMQNTGSIVSCDLHRSKLSLISDGAKRLGIDIISVREQDGRKFDESLACAADVVLCDAPCSGFGVMAKKPEIRYKDLSETARLPQIQSDILDNVCRYVRVGGALVYSTCTLLPEENEEQVKGFLSAHPEFEACDFELSCGLRSEGGCLTLTPDVHQTDGFFISRMIRKEK